MRFPYFKLATPKVTTWEDVRESILKAIEEEKKAEATIMPTISTIGTLPSIEPIMLKAIEEEKKAEATIMPTISAIGTLPSIEPTILKAIGEEKTANADLYIKEIEERGEFLCPELYRGGVSYATFW